MHLSRNPVAFGKLRLKAQSHRALTAPPQRPRQSTLLRDIHDAADVRNQLTVLVEVRLTDSMYVPNVAIWTNDPVLQIP